eukprot:11197457-Lingulodinium_polyedra.AAC.2
MKLPSGEVKWQKNMQQKGHWKYLECMVSGKAKALSVVEVEAPVCGAQKFWNLTVIQDCCGT